MEFCLNRCTRAWCRRVSSCVRRDRTVRAEWRLTYGGDPPEDGQRLAYPIYVSHRALAKRSGNVVGRKRRRGGRPCYPGTSRCDARRIVCRRKSAFAWAAPTQRCRQLRARLQRLSMSSSFRVPRGPRQCCCQAKRFELRSRRTGLAGSNALPCSVECVCLLEQPHVFRHVVATFL